MANGVIVMVGPSLKSRGGIASVICGYESAGLLKKWPIVYLNSHVEGTKGKKLLAAFKALRIFVGLLILRRAKVLHIHVARDVSFWRKSIFILLAYAGKCPVFVHLHSGGFSDFYWEKCGATEKKIVKFILDRADRIVVLSSQWWPLLEKITLNKRIVKIPNFILEAQGELSSCEREKSSALFLGRLSEEKGFFDLLEATALVKRYIPNFKLRCGGEGDVNDVMSRIKKLGIDRNVELLGWVDEEERMKLLECSTIFVLPSYVEGMPMAVIEAMSMGIPVVASNVGGVPDVIENGKEGILVGAGDVNAIAKALVGLLEDASERAGFALAGKRKVDQQFTAEKVLPNIENLYIEFGVSPNLKESSRG